MAEIFKTTDHHLIRRWAEERGGRPSLVTEVSQTDEAGLITIAFPECLLDDTCEFISWDQFFEIFDENVFVFLYQAKTDSGELSRVHDIIRWEMADLEEDIYQHSPENNLNSPREKTIPSRRVETTMTTDHTVIRLWVEKRNGQPASGKDIPDTDESGMLEIVFPDLIDEESFKPISWEEFFRIFNEENMVFLYEEVDGEGELSRFHQILHKHEVMQAIQE